MPSIFVPPRSMPIRMLAAMVHRIIRSAFSYGGAMALATSLEQLAPTFTGRFVQPSDADFDETRRVHNGLVDKRPSLIACCRGTADVADSVKLARTVGLEAAVRGGGHNVAGKA